MYKILEISDNNEPLKDISFPTKEKNVPLNDNKNIIQKAESSTNELEKLLYELKN